MNKQTLLIVGGLALAGVAGYFIWQQYKRQTNQQQPTSGNYVAPGTPAGNTLGNQIGTAVDTLSSIGDAFGL
jgi:predicted negative regulator of RcsB-dependent stress response